MPSHATPNSLKSPGNHKYRTSGVVVICKVTKEKPAYCGRGNPLTGGAGRNAGILDGVPYPLVIGLLGALATGSSSSSPLDVRSMTAEIVRFELVVEPVFGGGREDAEASLDCGDCIETGVLKDRGALILMLSPVLVISMRSSSESLVLATPFGRDGLEFSFLVCSSHFPSGCIVT